MSLSCFNAPKKPMKRSISRSKPKSVKVSIVKKQKPKTRSYYVRQLDKLFSEYIRRSKPAVCVTCGTHEEWKKLQNGHYYSRARLPTRWDVDNCWPQCVGCNVFRNGNYTEYALFMLRTHGESKLRELHDLSISGKKITTTVIKEMIEEYHAKLLTL